MDKRMHRVKVNAASTLLNQLVSTVSGMLIPWIMIRTFGSAAYGATTSIAQFLAYISLFEGGIGRVARGALYKPLADGDEYAVSKVYLAIKRFFRKLGIAFAGYTLILAFCYYDIANITEFTRDYIFAMVLAIAVGKFAEYMGGISNITLLNADQKQYVVNGVIMLSTLLNVLLVAILASSGVDILWVKLASSLVFVLKPIFLTLYIRSHYHIHKTKERAVLENKITGLAQHMAYVVQNNTDVLILTMFAGLEYVAVYSVYHMITYSLRNITSSFTGGMEAVFGNMIAKGEIDQLRAIYQRYKLILTVLTITLFGAAGALIVPFVTLYTWRSIDAEYVQPLFAVLLVMAEAINCLVLPCFNLPIAANRLKESQWGAYLEAGINLLISLLLVFWNPLVGIAIGTLVSAIFKSLYYIIYAGKNVLKINVGRLLVKYLAVVLMILGITMGGISLFTHIYIRHYLTWILAGICTVAVTGTIGLLWGSLLYPKTMKRMAKSIMAHFKRR
jgi:O-antigen/teichoic acid export membrane protein